MEPSILNSTKKILGLSTEYTPFDLDIITHINAVFGVLDQIGVGPPGGFMITGSDETWADFEVPQTQLNLVKTYMFLKVKFLFDPPTTSFLLEAAKLQIAEYEWRLNMAREQFVLPVVQVVTIDGGID